jgi:hypothetical protein
MTEVFRGFLDSSRPRLHLSTSFTHHNHVVTAVSEVCFHTVFASDPVRFDIWLCSSLPVFGCHCIERRIVSVFFC